MGYRAAWTNSTITSGTINVSIAPAAGELVIAWAITDASDTLKSYSAGWTPLAKLHSSADNADLFVLYKIADGSETTVSFQTNSGNSMIAGCAAFSGIDTTTPLDVAPVSIENSASGTTSDISITPVTNGAVLARVQCCDNGSTDATFTFSTSSGTTGAWTTRVDQHASYYDVALGTAEQTTAGAITNRCTTSVSGGRIGWLFALRPAASGTTYNDSLTESATVGDGLDPIASFFASYAESVAAGDSAANAQTHAAALSESVTPADSATSSQSHAETLAESVTADDSAASVQTMPVAFSEDVSAGDSADNAQTHAAAVAESVTPADSVTSAQGHTETLAESVTPADSAASAHAMPASVSEGVTTGDSVAGDVVPAGSFNETIAESATVAEVLATSQIHVTPLGETVAVGDAYAVTGGTEVAVSSGGGIDPDEALYAFTDWQRVKWKKPAAKKKAQALVAQLEREKKREPEDPIHARLIAERITQLQAQIAAQFDELVPHLQAHESKRQRQERNRRVIAAFLETI